MSFIKLEEQLLKTNENYNKALEDYVNYLESVPALGAAFTSDNNFWKLKATKDRFKNELENLIKPMPSTSNSQQLNATMNTDTDTEVETIMATCPIHRALKETFKLESFRPGQLDVVNAVLSGKDCFIRWPTGSGKSLCFQLPAIISDSITIVFCPLKTKMIFLTPEKFFTSTRVRELMGSLHQRNAIAQFVTDEVHCIR